jgi:hypothetical protein
MTTATTVQPARLLPRNTAATTKWLILHRSLRQTSRTPGLEGRMQTFGTGVLDVSGDCETVRLVGIVEDPIATSLNEAK